MRHGCKQTIEQPECVQPSPHTAQRTHKNEHTHNINSTTAFYSKGYKSNQLYRSFNVPVRERNMMIVCPVFIASSRLHLSVDDELCCGKRCYFHDRQSQTNSIPHPTES